MDLAVGLPLRNQQELDTLLKDLFDPASPNFHHYLTAAQFSDRFSPSEEDYQALAAFFLANGFAVSGTHPNRMILDINGSVADVQRTLHVNMMTWRHPQRGEFFAPDRDPSIEAGVTILDISGLDNFVLPHPMDLHSRLLDKPRPQAKALTTGSGPAGLFSGNDFRNAYAPSVTLNGAGQSVGLFELDGFHSSDVAANFQQAGLPPVPVKTVLLDGYSGGAGSNNVEVTLDIMMAAYMAPGVNNIIVYEGTNWNDVLNRMATDNAASTLSSSWCFSPTNATTEQIFSEMIAQGQSMFQASGDSGAYTGWIMPPADDPNVTVVGGTSLTTAGAGGAWQSEAAWGDSGGGVSTTWPIPGYQKTVNTAAAGGSATMRNIPDVALLADVQIFLICNNGQWIEVGGTSAAAPLWAGFLALANQQAANTGKPRVGFLNPTIYSIGSGSTFSSDLHDITSGSNNGFNTHPGYDLVTGWGTPRGQSLIDSLTAAAGKPSFGLSSSASALSLAAGSSGASTITISPQNDFSGTVNLSVSGLPSGVTASFSPAAATTSSTLTFMAANTAAASSSTLTITGTSGDLTSTARVQLAVTAAAAFALTAAPSNLSLVQGTHVTSTITVTPGSGFTGSVTLAVSGLPSGVTAALSPATTTKTSTLTLNATTSAKPGSYTAMITGTSGSNKNTTPITFTVTGAPSFVITATPTSLTAVRGSSANTAIALAPENGFSGPVTLTASGLPSGVAASFSPISAAQPATLTLTANGSAALGAHTVTITGASGGISSKATVTLTITAAPSFSLSAVPSVLTLNPGKIGQSTIAITSLNGFNGAVSLAASGLPGGVTAAFGAQTGGKSVLTFTAAPTAIAGLSSVTVTGTSGSLVSKATIALTVTPPPTFTLSAASTSLTVTAGASVSTSITITDKYGFDSAVSLAGASLPAGATVSFGAVSGGRCLATFSVAGSTPAGATSVTVTGSSGSLASLVKIALTIRAAPAFTLSASPSALSVQPGATGASTLTITPVNGFTGAVALSVSGLPSGVVAALVSSAKPALQLAITASAAPGQSVVTITGKSGSLTSAATVTLNVLGSNAGTALVNITPMYNVPALVTDFTPFGGGLDGGGHAYSANLLGAVRDVNGAAFSFASPDGLGAVSSATVALPNGRYSTLALLATAVNGQQLSQVFTVMYTDGSTSTFTQSLSDWCTPQNYPGESKAVAMTYRNNSNGSRDTRPLALYGYSFNLASGKTVRSITLPNNRNVVVLAMSLH
jgi:Pro-kumamolisin, activation domain